MAAENRVAELLDELETTGAADAAASQDDASRPYVGRWRRLVSTTNWEKGRIICEWRTARERDGQDASDEAWAQLVGDVTSQHVGRLRRAWQRFGGVSAEYEGLFWSHFQAALDWDDAEMWLEGALQNGWSVSQMRARRGETLGGATADAEPQGALDAPFDTDDAPAEAAPLRGEEAEVASLDHDQDAGAEGDDSPRGGDPAAEHVPAAPRERAKPMRDLAELPDDLADAFEAFKLAILAHKLTGWGDVSRDDVVGALDALRQLALAPSGE